MLFHRKRDVRLLAFVIITCTATWYTSKGISRCDIFIFLSYLEARTCATCAGADSGTWQEAYTYPDRDPGVPGRIVVG